MQHGRKLIALVAIMAGMLAAPAMAQATGSHDERGPRGCAATNGHDCRPTPRPRPQPQPPQHEHCHGGQPGCVPCPTCPSGPAGPQGPAGPAGPQGPPGQTIVITRTEIVIQDRVCTSRRLQRPILRRRYPGVRNTQGFEVIGVDTSKTKTRGTGGVLERGVWTGIDSLGNNIATDFTIETINGVRRVRLWIDTRGRTFNPYENELRSTVWLRVRLADGRLASRRVIYRSAVCRSEQGNPNDENARSPEIPG